MEFGQKKFMALPYERQHKKCAELLRLVYEKILLDQDSKSLIEHYNCLQEWMETNIKVSINLKEISDRYHQHLRHAKFHLKEHNLLPSIRSNDKPDTHTDPWEIAIY